MSEQQKPTSYEALSDQEIDTMIAERVFAWKWKAERKRRSSAREAALRALDASKEQQG